MHSTVSEIVERQEDLESPDVAAGLGCSGVVNHAAAMIRVPIAESTVQVCHKRSDSQLGEPGIASYENTQAPTERS